MIDNFIIITLGILIEVFPFLILAALFSGIVEEFVPARVVMRLIPKRLHHSIFIGAIMGIALPMCECGSVLVARRLIGKGMPSAMAITYMLAGPIINPITIASTYTAYQWYPQMVLLRVGLGVSTAIITGLIIYKLKSDDIIQGQREIALPVTNSDNPVLERLRHALIHAMNDFIMIFSMLLLGATITALFKSFTPAEVFMVFKREEWLGVPIFAGSAVMLSLCAEADAFISSALNSVFDIPSQLAFLALGPMLDIKLIMMYQKVFQRKVFFILCTVPPVFIISACLIFQGGF